MNRAKRREKFSVTGTQLEKMTEHNIREGFEQGKVATIAKMTEVYTVAAAYAVLDEPTFSNREAKGLVDHILATFTAFNKGEVDYDEAKVKVETTLGISFEMMPSETKQDCEDANQP